MNLLLDTHTFLWYSTDASALSTNRMIVAQSLAEGMPIAGNDPAMDAYGVARIW